MEVTYLNQKDAIELDEQLMGPLGFSVDQLMELAGLSVASAVAAEYQPGRVLVIAGPGNNGGDGLVAARHLHHFGYDVEVCYPKQTDRPLYKGLVTQCQGLGLKFVSCEELQVSPLRERYDVVLDAIFGFSFKGSPRPPFDTILQMLAPAADPPPVVSVDIPSGWDVEQGDVSGGGLRPQMLVSLTTPKLAARHFQGKWHYLGGRFVPPAIKERYKLQLPSYPGASQCVLLPPGPSPQASPQDVQDVQVSDMRVNYEQGGLLEADCDADPLQQFDRWFKEAVASQVSVEPNAMAVASVGPEGRPSLRMVLLKGYDDRGLVFYTNYTSRKGVELDGSGQAAACIFWEGQQRQVRVEGPVERVPEAESDAYFASRPRGSQIGAWVSEQSSVLAGGRAELEARNEQLKQQYADESMPVPRPPHWGGFLIQPLYVEFWQGRPSRLHDRIVYRRSSLQEPWRLERLSP